MMTSIIIGQSQRDKETREPDDAISITSGSEEGREKRPAMDLARGLSSAKWADDGSLWQAFVASVRQLAAEKQLDLTVLHGDGTNTVAKKGAMALATRATNIRRATRSLPSSTIMAMSSRLSLWLRSMRPTWSCYRKARRRSKRWRKRSG
jgi:hypothetical protein